MIKVQTGFVNKACFLFNRLLFSGVMVMLTERRERRDRKGKEP